MSERRAWLCPQCARFLTRAAADDAPLHDCPTTGGPVALIAYVDSTQAEHLRAVVEHTR